MYYAYFEADDNNGKFDPAVTAETATNLVLGVEYIIHSGETLNSFLALSYRAGDSGEYDVNAIQI